MQAAVGRAFRSGRRDPPRVPRPERPPSPPLRRRCGLRRGTPREAPLRVSHRTLSRHRHRARPRRLRTRLVSRADWRFESVRDCDHPGAGRPRGFRLLLLGVHPSRACGIVSLPRRGARVARPGGRIVFSFLEFAVVRHWTVLRNGARPVRAESQPAIVFMSRDAIDAWVAHLPVSIEAIHAGDEAQLRCRGRSNFPMVRIRAQARLGPIGQSVCILRRT